MSFIEQVKWVYCTGVSPLNGGKTTKRRHLPNLFNTRSLAVSFPFGCQIPVCNPLFTYQSRFKINKPIYLKILYNNVLLFDKFIRLKSNASRKSLFINVCLKKINLILKTTLPPFIYSLLLISSICKLKISYCMALKIISYEFKALS